MNLFSLLVFSFFSPLPFIPFLLPYSYFPGTSLVRHLLFLSLQVFSHDWSFLFSSAPQTHRMWKRQVFREHLKNLIFKVKMLKPRKQHIYPKVRSKTEAEMSPTLTLLGLCSSELGSAFFCFPKAEATNCQLRSHLTHK